MRRLLAALPRFPRPRPAKRRHRFVPLGWTQPLEERIVLSTVEPFKVPLEWVDVSKPTDAEKTYKLGIYVGIGEGEPKIYEFDTGGKGFFAAYNPNLPDSKQWWGDFDVVRRRNLSITYSSGNQYLANQVSTSVQLYAQGPDEHSFSMVVGTSQDVDLGQIIRYTDPNPANVRAWNQALRDGDPPLGGVFYGDFGAALAPIGQKGTGTIYSILPQIALPEGLTAGFLVHAGEPGDGTEPYLQLGLTTEDVTGAETPLPMNRYTGPLSKRFPVTHLPTYSEQVSTANFSWSDSSGHRQRFENVGWTIDTGALLVNVWQGKDLKVQRRFLDRPRLMKGYHIGRFKSGQTFTVDAQAINPGGANFELRIDPTGRTTADDLVSASYHTTKSMGRNYINTGLLTFKQFDVMFDLQGGTIHFRKPAAS